MEEHEDSIQMWLESYNTYHLVDGAAMKEAWGSIMPHIMLAEKNLDAILDQVWSHATASYCMHCSHSRNRLQQSEKSRTNRLPNPFPSPVPLLGRCDGHWPKTPSKAPCSPPD
jgi:hypothetical protein